MSEENFQEQVNAYLLGKLSAGQTAAFERAMTTDGALRGLLRLREEELERMTLEISPQVEPPVAVRENLLAATASDGRASSRAAARRKPPATALGWPAIFRGLSVAAAALALLAICARLWGTREQARRENNALRGRMNSLAIENGALQGAREKVAALRDARERLEREVAALRAQADDNGRGTTALREQLARAERDLLAARDQNVFTRLQVGSLQPPPGASPTPNPTSAPRDAAKGFALWDPQRQEGMLVVENLPVPRPDQDYQVWVADPARPGPVPSGVFHPARVGGQEVLRFVTNERIERATQFMVTLERKGGVSRITGPSVLESLPRR